MCTVGRLYEWIVCLGLCIELYLCSFVAVFTVLGVVLSRLCCICAHHIAFSLSSCAVIRPWRLLMAAVVPLHIDNTIAFVLQAHRSETPHLSHAALASRVSVYLILMLARHCSFIIPLLLVIFLFTIT